MEKLFRLVMPNKCRSDLQRAAEQQKAVARRVANMLVQHGPALVEKMKRPVAA